MRHESGVVRWRRRYAVLLRWYPRSFRARFGEAMEQTFADLCRERMAHGSGLFAFALRTFASTTFQIMRENLAAMTPWHRSVLRLAAVVGLILLAPLAAMRFTDEVNWTASDFAFAGTLLFGTGLAYQAIARNRNRLAYRAATALVLLTVLLLVWINAAVGIIGSENNPANLLYAGVIAVGAIGAAIVRLEPRGMSHTLFAMSAAQMLVPVVALPFWAPSFSEPPGLPGVFALNAMFAVLLALSALMYRRAALSPH